MFPKSGFCFSLFELEVLGTGSRWKSAVGDSVIGAALVIRVDSRTNSSDGALGISRLTMGEEEAGSEFIASCLA